MDGLRGQHIHGLLLRLDDPGQLVDHVILVFQGTPLDWCLALQLMDLPSVVILQLPVLFGGLPQGLDIGEQFGANGGGVTH